MRRTALIKKYTSPPFNASIRISLPEKFFEMAKGIAIRRGVSYQSVMREALADFVVKADQDKKEGRQ